jgi:hypothetical protein
MHDVGHVERDDQTVIHAVIHAGLLFRGVMRGVALCVKDNRRTPIDSSGRLARLCRKRRSVAWKST